MQTFDWPTSFRPLSVEFTLIVPQLVARSVFDGSTQADTMGAPRWGFTVTTGAYKLSDLPPIEAFFNRLRGATNRVRAWDWRRESPRGVATGAPTVRVAGGGSTLQTQGWTASVAGILKAGDWFSVNGELKQLVVDLDSDSAGRGVATFEPPLRAQAPVNAPLLLVKPTSTYILTSEPPRWGQQGAKVTQQTMTFEEDFRP